MRKKQIVNAKPKNEHMILNNFFRPLHIFPMLLGHQEALPKHLHHSWSQSIQFPENWHICLIRGQVILIGTFLFLEVNHCTGLQQLLKNASETSKITPSIIKQKSVYCPATATYFSWQLNMFALYWCPCSLTGFIQN